jgi:hypothetical protein
MNFSAVAGALRALADAIEAEDPPVAPAGEQLLDYVAVGKMLDVHPITARGMGDRGEWPEVRGKGLGVRVRKADVEEYIRSRARRARTA